MKNSLLGAVALLLMQVFGATAADNDSVYREALLKELNNRMLAGHVVGALAEAHKDKPQGEFWLAYSQLEAWQWPLYAEQAAQHELSPGGFFLSLKARASILFARLLPNRFIGMLTQATQDYAAELQAVAPPAEQQAFWRYVIAQEQAQAAAFQQAANGDYAKAGALLVDFMTSGAAQ